MEVHWDGLSGKGRVGWDGGVVKDPPYRPLVGSGLCAGAMNIIA